MTEWETPQNGMKFRYMGEKLGIIWLRKGFRGQGVLRGSHLGFEGVGRLVSGMAWRCREKERKELSHLFSVYLRAVRSL